MVNSPGLEVAIFGGSFDPPHAGHQQIVEACISQLDIDRLIVLPAYLNPFKSNSLADADMRLQWCRTLFEPLPNVIVSDYEIRQGRSVKTAESVKHFQKFYHVKYLVIGADNLSTLTQWHDFTWLNEQVTWLIISRPGYAMETGALKNWRLLTLNVPVSSSQIRQEQDVSSVDTKIAPLVKEILKGNNL